MKQYRDQGAVGALLDEYEKAVTEVITVLSDVSDQKLTTIVDDKTTDPDCRSIQTILTHVIRAGYCYVIEIRKSLGEQIDFVERKPLNRVKEYQTGLQEMFIYNEQFFEDYPDLHLEEKDPDKKIVVAWGQRYNIEQLLEHAIVHILRHRRQIERFLIKLNT
ncbi:putative damage-inducible protein DinB [Aquimarina sp. EL_43]|uniref:DinB family protein n=1 Tax=unclassified Aquimarina TaxID=2627091 RepID=UPI0018C8DA35|nr:MULTISPECIES: DinB family protein [unclassified Aquimarina]MBG6130710.1 putative damage-inducible protein DinB [Aquimarina sp. EL_35]MBG6151144.1 putative damage-inducible protein DinB [Aquimarina sp. EL_32]MBG6169112.1 putative damage-inducible protein DinB [Aquimarina sp. EL_43]